MGKLGTGSHLNIILFLSPYFFNFKSLNYIFTISSLKCEPVPNLEPMKDLFKLFNELGERGRGEGEYKGEKS
jgi:hypothetical protein